MDKVCKYSLIEKIVNTDNEVLLQQVKHLLDQEEAEDWDGLPEELRNSIQEGVDQMDRGEGIPHDVVMKEIRAKYLKK